uniref:Uncharacterized protein n=1 Tax=Physcomitrium patens TaxID=3218 RepID=A0A2K1JYC5_PHYPA|nr:hypothetical protein PHYPA_013641 [Physcomitrium patens]
MASPDLFAAAPSEENVSIGEYQGTKY